MAINPKQREEQHCFFINGFVYCNFIIRKNGTVVYPKKTNYLKFYSGNRIEEKKEEKRKVEVNKKS